MSQTPTVTIPRQWVEAILKDPAPSRLERFCQVLRQALAAQDQAWARMHGPAPAAATTAAPSVLDEADSAACAEFGAALSQRLADEFPQARQPTQPEIRELFGYFGADPTALDDILLVIGRIAAKRDETYINHIPGLLKGIRNHGGPESIRAEAAAVRKLRPHAAQQEADRRRENQRLARQAPPPSPPDPDELTRMRAWAQQILEGREE